MTKQEEDWNEWRYCESCDYQWRPGEFDNSCAGCGGHGRNGTRSIEKKSMWSVERIISSWDDWEAEAGQQAQVEQDQAAAERCMKEHLRHEIDWLLASATAELSTLRAENERLREASIVLCAKVEECVLSSNHCFGNHDYNCRWEIAYWHQANRDSIAQYEAAQDAGCNCGLSDEHDQVEAAVHAMREILKPQQEQGK